MAAALTEKRRAIRDAVQPLLREDEEITVAVGPNKSAAGLDTQEFHVTISVGLTGDEEAAERLDELLSGVVKDALEGSELNPTVPKNSGYQSLPRPGAPPLLGATWTAELLT